MMGYSSFARYYDLLTGDVGYCDRAKYFDTLIKLHSVIDGRLLLDLGCGTGSLAVELAELGYDVIGVDASPEMLSVAMGKGGSNSANILYLNQLMWELDLYGTVDICVSALDSLNHIIDYNRFMEAFKKVSLFINKGGIFIFDVNSIYKHEEVMADNTFVYESGDVYCVWRNSYDDSNRLSRITLDFFERSGGNYTRSAESFLQRAYTHNEILNAVNRSGFDLVAQYEGDKLISPGNKSERLVYVAVKR